MPRWHNWIARPPPKGKVAGSNPARGAVSFKGRHFHNRSIANIGCCQLDSLKNRLFQLLLRASRIQQWLKNLTADGNLRGAPADETKLRDQFLRDLWMFLKCYVSTQWTRFRTIGVRLRVKAIRPVRLHRKFIITLTDLPMSVEAAERCIASARQCGEERGLEILPAVDRFQSQAFFSQHGLTWRRYDETTDSDAGMGCFASHYTLWQRCIELGEPIIVLEHDAVFRFPVPPLRFKHVIMLGEPFYFSYCLKKISAHKKREIFHYWRFLMGTHAYAITPEGARRLVEAAHRQLLPPVDLHMCKRNVDLLYFHPCPITLDVRFTSISNVHTPVVEQKQDVVTYETPTKQRENTDAKRASPPFPADSKGAASARQIDDAGSGPRAIGFRANIKPLLQHGLVSLILIVPTARRLHRKIVSENRLWGAPVNDEKLWNFYKIKIFKFLWERLKVKLDPIKKWTERNWQIELRTVFVHVRARTIKPVKPTRKFIITLTNLPQSVRVAERCIESAKRCGEHHGLEIAPAVDKFKAMDFFLRHNFTWYHTDYNVARAKDPLPEMGCFASHYLVWKRCIELEEPIIVLEHDAIFRRPIPPLRFKHIILLSKPSYMIGGYELDKIRQPHLREIFYPMHVLAAAHCYAITPAAARILVKAAHRELIVPADSFICKDRVNILYFHPYLVDFDFEFSTIDERYVGSPTPESVWENYRTTP